jgi:hypothetical protein
MYFINYLRCLIFFLGIASVFGAEDELIADFRRENRSRHLRFTMFGGSQIDRTNFLELVQVDRAYQLRFFDAPDSSFLKEFMDVRASIQQSNIRSGVSVDHDLDRHLDEVRSRSYSFLLTLEESRRIKLSYLFKREHDKLLVLFSGYLGKQESETLVFGDLIRDAFSIAADINELEIYAPFHSNHFFGGHAEFMQLSCHAVRGVVTASINTFDSTIERRMGRSKANLAIMHALQQQFAKKAIILQSMQRIFLGLQSINSTDCNVFTAAFLYLKWKTELDPQEVKNERRLYEVMQLLVERRAVYKGQKRKKIVGKAKKFYEYLNKQLGIWHREALDQQPSNLLNRTLQQIKINTYELMGFCVGLPANIINWSLRFVGF